MYVCYLDDSYASDGTVMSIAGYVATEEAWAKAEVELAAVFQAFHVNLLHATDFKSGRACFAGWSLSTRKAFVHGLGMTFRHLTMAVSVNVNRVNYKTRQAELNVNPGMSAFGVAFAATVHTIARGNSLWKVVDQEGLRFVVEHGNNNNEEIALHFERLKTHDLYGDCLKGLEFSTKSGSRAIQIADFFAYYARRWADRAIVAGDEAKTDRGWELDTLDHYLPHAMRVMTDAYLGNVAMGEETFYQEDRPAGPLPSERPVTPRPRRPSAKPGKRHVS